MLVKDNFDISELITNRRELSISLSEVRSKLAELALDKSEGYYHPTHYKELILEKRNLELELKECKLAILNCVKFNSIEFYLEKHKEKSLFELRERARFLSSTHLKIKNTLQIERFTFTQQEIEELKDQKKCLGNEEYACSRLINKLKIKSSEEKVHTARVFNRLEHNRSFLLNVVELVKPYVTERELSHILTEAKNMFILRSNGDHKGDGIERIGYLIKRITEESSN
jgi:FtsZ-binding cell division protein ZapB